MSVFGGRMTRARVRGAAASACVVLGWIIVLPTAPFVIAGELFWSLAERIRP